MTHNMTTAERRAVFATAAIMSLRMLGVFMILPVFALYAQHLEGASIILIGVAIGAHGLSQALLQIPFGMMSDRFGRKPVIAAGLIIFAIGGAVAALSTHIWGVILGRVLQGGGAIASALMALTADLTREERRTQAMAVIGMSIGISVVTALALGPVLNRWIGAPGIFWLISGFALVSLFILYRLVPCPQHSHFHRDTEPEPSQFAQLLANSELLRLNFGVMILHAQFTALFVALPLTIVQAGLDSAHHWLIYSPVLLLALAGMTPLMILAEKRRKLKQMLIAAVSALCIAQIGLTLFHTRLISIGVLLWVFFTAFILLEASLPSLVSKIAPADSKGGALGVYSTSQFLGIFLGGLGGGWLHHHYGVTSVFAVCAALAALWLVWVTTMRAPRYLSSYMLNVGDIDDRRAHQIAHDLLQLQGVVEAVVIPEEGVAYLKIDEKQIDFEQVDKFSAPEESS